YSVSSRPSGFDLNTRMDPSSTKATCRHGSPSTNAVAPLGRRAVVIPARRSSSRISFRKGNSCFACAHIGSSSTSLHPAPAWYFPACPPSYLPAETFALGERCSCATSRNAPGPHPALGGPRQRRPAGRKRRLPVPKLGALPQKVPPPSRRGCREKPKATAREPAALWGAGTLGSCVPDGPRGRGRIGGRLRGRRVRSSPSRHARRSVRTAVHVRRRTAGMVYGHVPG